MMSLLNGQADVDKTKIGVSEGDEFYLEVSELSLVGFTDWNIRAFWSGIFDKLIFEGDILKYKITNSTYEEGYGVRYNRISPDGTTSSGNTICTIYYLDVFEKAFILFTDWDYWETDAETVIKDRLSWNDDTFDKINISRSATSFSITLDYSWTSGSVHNEFVYNINTGFIERYKEVYTSASKIATLLFIKSDANAYTKQTETVESSTSSISSNTSSGTEKSENDDASLKFGFVIIVPFMGILINKIKIIRKSNYF